MRIQIETYKTVGARRGESMSREASRIIAQRFDVNTPARPGEQITRELVLSIGTTKREPISEFWKQTIAVVVVVALFVLSIYALEATDVLDTKPTVSIWTGGSAK